MEELNVLSWGGGTQSTALMIKMLKGEIFDSNKKPIQLDYIMFADTKDEQELVYKQIYKVIKYVKETYNKDIVITARNKKMSYLDQVIKMIEDGTIKNYRNSEYADLYQSHVLYFKGIVNSIDIMPLWTRNKITGKVGKTKFKQCTFTFKIIQLLKELRILLGIKKFDKKKHHINMFIGYSYDELARVKPNPKSYATNHAPLVNNYVTRQQCIDYVEKELGFIPRSSVCNICFANDFYRVYDIYKNDKKGWERVLYLDQVMNDKPEAHKLRDDVFMYRFQAKANVRLKGISMEELKIKYDKEKETGQTSIFDFIGEQEYGCNGGCFL